MDKVYVSRDLAPTQTSNMAMGAANSAPVPSADDLGKDEDDSGMAVDAEPNGAA